MICQSEELADGKMKKFQIGQVEVLAGRIHGRLFACNNTCPHRGASLALGHIEGDNVVCYMHGYEYNVFNGRLVKMKSWKKEETWMEQSPAWRQSGDLESYDIIEQDGAVYIRLDNQGAQLNK
ncbi:MAG: Rieske 2Fe-2S domain-containing protein [Nitrososphaera sp.]|jgi:nitrite reductase/ring-hydroxylating ferredoxin subunit